MYKALFNIITLLYLAIVVASVFSINEIPVISDMTKKEKTQKVIKRTLMRFGKLIGALVLIGILVQVLSSIG